MKSVSQNLKEVGSVNVELAKQGSLLEAGRVANNRTVAILKDKLPMAIRGYADSPLFKILAANAVLVAVNQFRPESKLMVSVAQSMVAAAYQENIQKLDIEGMLDKLFDDKKLQGLIKGAVEEE